MAAINEESLQIQVVPSDQLAEALWLVFDWEPEAQRRHRVAVSLQMARGGDSAFQHLVEARRGGVRVAAAWGYSAPGRVASVWPPSLVAGESSTTADRLQAELDHLLQATNLACAQSLLSSEAHEPAACLLRSGYSLAAELLFLACDAQQIPVELPISDLVFEPYRVDQQLRMAQLIDATYVDTQDAPALNGMRATDDVMEGYQRTGTFSPELWRFVRHLGRDVGCLLVADHPEVGKCELIYMGLIPSARGRGWGAHMTRYAQWLTRQAGRDALLLGVDAANYPGLATYARCGFHEVDRRLAFCKRLK